jgi:hypothetical protein
MSYEDTNCPCGDKKERETMICQQCETTFASTTEVAALKIPDWPFEAKRCAAIRLLAMCRRRKRDYPFLGELFQRQLP